MNKKINVVETRTNGYLCGCCGRSWHDDDWIEEEEMIPFEEMVHQALCVNPSNEYSVTDLNYYDVKGMGIYGFSTSYGRDYCDVSISIGEEEFLLKKNEQILLTIEDLIEKYHLFLKNKGEL